MQQSSVEFSEYKYSIGRGIFRKIKVAKDWNSPQLLDVLIHFERYFGQGRTFHDYRNVLVRISQNDELGIKKEIVAKKFKLVRKYDRFRFRFLPSKADRSLVIATALLQNGLNTPRPVAVIEDRDKFNRLYDCYYLTEFLEYDCSFSEIANKLNDRAMKEKIIIEAGLQIRLLHDSGIVHNDLHTSNILIKNITTEPELYFIDLNRARIKVSLSLKTRAKDLGRLSFNRTEQLVFLKSYDPIIVNELLILVDKSHLRRAKWVTFKDWVKKIKAKL